MSTPDTNTTQAAPAPEPVPVETPSPAPVSTPGESTSPVVEDVKPEVKATEGSTPEVTPAAPASAVPTTSAVEALAKRGFKVEDEKLATEYLRLESEFAAIKRAEKAAQKAQPVESQPVTQQTAPEPTPVIPAVEQPQFATPLPDELPEHPEVGRVELPAEVAQRITQLVADDSVCRAIAQKYNETEAKASEIAQFDREGRLTGGKAYALANQINEIERLLTPSETLKSLGIEPPVLDEIQRGNMKLALMELRFEQRSLYDTYQAQLAQRDAYGNQFNARANGYRAHFENQVLQAKAEADRSAELETKEARFRERWLAEEVSVVRDLKVPEELAQDVKDAMKAAALLHINSYGAISENDVARVMRDAATKELQKFDKAHRAKSAEYAKAKIADAAAATPGPPAAAAVASPAPIDNSDWEERLAAKKLAMFKSASR